MLGLIARFEIRGGPPIDGLGDRPAPKQDPFKSKDCHNAPVQVILT